jgi:C1A family cysteine protease
MASLDLKSLQRTIAAEGAQWEAGSTEMTELSDEDFLLHLGAEPPPDSASLFERERSAASRLQAEGPEAPAAPASWDWRSQGGSNYLGEVRDQKSCGSCVAFGTIAAIEGTTRVTAKRPTLTVDLSEAHLFYCHGASEGRKCSNGWWPEQALEAVRSKGIVDEACFPYTPGDQACRPCSDASSRLVKITSWRSLSSIAEMKTWIAEKGPLIGCFTVYEDFRSYRSGVYRHVSGNQLGGHCIAVVGYSDAERAWIIRNSWGPGWAESGYGRIGYGEVGIDYEMWGVVVSGEVPVDNVVTIQNALITGLWVNVDTTTSWAYVDQYGWRQLANMAFLTAAAAARVARAKCTITMKDDQITELYVM